MNKMLENTGWKSTVVGILFGLILFIVETNGIEHLTIKEILVALEPVVLAFLVNNKYFK